MSRSHPVRIGALMSMVLHTASALAGCPDNSAPAATETVGDQAIVHCRCLPGYQNVGGRCAALAQACANGDEAIARTRLQIAQTQAAIRKLGLATTAEAFEQIQKATEDQRSEYQRDLIEATASAVFSTWVTRAQTSGLMGVASIGTAQANHLRKLAVDFGITNPDVLDAITAIGRAKDKRKTVNEALKLLQAGVEQGVAGLKVMQSEDAWAAVSNLLGFTMVFVTEAAPEFAAELARKMPVLAVSAAGTLSIGVGLATAPALASTIDNLIMLRHPRAAIDALDRATDGQLKAIRRLRERMEELVDQLDQQRSSTVSCHP